MSIASLQTLLLTSLGSGLSYLFEKVTNQTEAKRLLCLRSELVATVAAELERAATEGGSTCVLPRSRGGGEEARSREQGGGDRLSGRAGRGAFLASVWNSLPALSSQRRGPSHAGEGTGGRNLAAANAGALCLWREGASALSRHFAAAGGAAAGAPGLVTPPEPHFYTQLARLLPLLAGDTALAEAGERALVVLAAREGQQEARETEFHGGHGRTAPARSRL